jgi:large subunit ribosomal protein L2
MAKKLKNILKKKSGRNFSGQITTRHQGGRMKRYLRSVDFKRDKKDIKARVEAIEHDPNRGADLARLLYIDGERRYILAPENLKVNDEVIASVKADAKVGNALPLRVIPLGTLIHNIELKPGKGGQLARGAGTVAVLQEREEKLAVVKLPSGEVRKVSLDCWATCGSLSNRENKLRKFSKAGTKRRLGIRPTVRGVAQNPKSHPHGGGEGRSPIGMPSPKSPWGKKTLGKRTRKKRKYSDHLIIKARK